MQFVIKSPELFFCLNEAVNASYFNIRVSGLNWKTPNFNATNNHGLTINNLHFVNSPPICSSPVNVHMPKDRITQSHQGYGFVEFMGEDDADYAIKIMNMIKLYGKPIRVNKVGTDLQIYCDNLSYII